MHTYFDNSWNYSICENCRRNFDRESKMKKEKIRIGSKVFEVWVCDFCGYTKKL